MISASVTGLADIQKQLGRLKTAASRKIMRRGVTGGAKVINKAQKRGAAKDTGLLKKSIGQKVKVYRNSGAVVGIVGPRKGFRTIRNGRPVDPVKYAHIADKGRGPVRARMKRVLSDGKNVFGVRVHAYRGQAFVVPSSRDPSIARAMANEAGKALVKELNRGG
jgi:hypothetical protein